MELFNIINKLSILESEGILNPSDIFKRHSFSHVESVLVCYETALRYGVPSSQAQEILSSLEDISKPEIISKPEVISKPEIISKPLADEYPILNQVITKNLKALWQSKPFLLTPKDISRLSNVELTRELSAAITAYFRDTHNIMGSLVVDYTRPAKTRTREYLVSFKQDMRELWSNLSGLPQSPQGLPILIFDYLDGTEDGFRWFKNGEEFYIQIDHKELYFFKEKLSECFQLAYGTPLFGDLIPNTPFNKYLLDLAFKATFPPVSLKSFVRDRAPLRTEEKYAKLETLLKEAHGSMTFTQGVISEPHKLNSTFCGFSYLVLATLFGYLIDEIH